VGEEGKVFRVDDPQAVDGRKIVIPPRGNIEGGNTERFELSLQMGERFPSLRGRFFSPHAKHSQ
jgi:hypothetical protein